VAPSLIRAALVVLAVLVGAWLALGLRAVELEEDGNATLERARAGPVPIEEVRRARRDLQRARRFSSDLAPLVDEGNLLAAVGRAEEAARIAARATTEEPENLEGWLLAYRVAPDRARAQAALRRIGGLNPLVPDDLR
jgi:hypothetical protein